jgi:uncharacterized coiled-coil protein SlyX
MKKIIKKYEELQVKKEKYYVLQEEECALMFELGNLQYYLTMILGEEKNIVQEVSKLLKEKIKIIKLQGYCENQEIYDEKEERIEELETKIEEEEERIEELEKIIKEEEKRIEELETKINYNQYEKDLLYNEIAGDKKMIEIDKEELSMRENNNRK